MRAALPIEVRPGWWRREAGGASEAVADGRPGDTVAFAALVAFTWVLFLAPQVVFPALARLRPALLAAGVAAGALVLRRLADRQPLVRPGREALLAAGLAAWSLATAPLSYWPGGTVGLLLDVYLKTLSVFWLLTELVTTPSRLRRMCLVLALTSVPLALTGVWNFAQGAFVGGAGERRIVGYDAPLTHNPNDLALVLNLVLPLTVALAVAARRPAARLGLALVALLQVAAVVLTFSRAGFLTLMVAASAYAARRLSRGDGRPAAGLAVAALLALPLLPAGYAERLGTIFDVEADPTGSAQARWGDLGAALRFVADHPVLGAGAGMNVLALNEVRGPAWKEVHNVYLEYAVDLGLPGLALFVALLACCLGAAVAAQQRSRGRAGLKDVSRLAEGIEASLVAFAVAALFHPAAYRFYFFYVGGLAVAARSACQGDGREAP